MKKCIIFFNLILALLLMKYKNEYTMIMVDLAKIYTSYCIFSPVVAVAIVIVGRVKPNRDLFLD